jgi:probable poly-beta-1,6-N-acetyl-D-glucosamine export protein
MNHVASVQDGRAIDVAVAPPAAQPEPREHIAYIEYFRAVAILLIIAGHTYAVSWTHFVDEDPQTRVTWLNVIPALITGGTAYFVFISGFLYRQVFYGRVAYSAFMRKKALYVGLPYLVLATPLALAEIWLGPFSVTAVKGDVAYPHSYFVDFIVLFSTGRMVTAYWYIPFIFLVFLASPLFDRFIELSKGWRAAVLAASIAIAFWVVRPIDNLNPVQCFFYFANFYMFGILFCEYRKPIMDFISRPIVIAGLAVAILAIASVQAMIMQFPGNLERYPSDGLGFVGFDAMLIQKYIGILLFCGLLTHVGGWLKGPLSFIADISFGLFFVHGIVIAVLMRLPEPLSPHVGEPVTDLAIYSVLVISLSVVVVVVAKYITGKYSRYIIGC